MKIEDKLSDQEKAKIQQFIGDKVMVGAVKKVLLANNFSGALKEGEEPDYTRNFAFSLVMNEQGDRYAQTDEDLGQKLRASVEGLAYLTDGFKKLEEFKKVEEAPVAKENPAK